jgi:hypothetical protein
MDILDCPSLETYFGLDSWNACVVSVRDDDHAEKDDGLEELDRRILGDMIWEGCPN